MTSPKSLSVNTPYEPPPTHWQQGAGTSLNLVDGRRPAAYEVFDTRNNTKRTEELKLVNRIRESVQEWRGEDYPGITQVTRGLLEHWQEHEARTLPFYFCQRSEEHTSEPKSLMRISYDVFCLTKKKKTPLDQ